MDLREINDINQLKAMAYDTLVVKQNAEADLVKIDRRIEQVQAEQAAEATETTSAGLPAEPTKVDVKTDDAATHEPS